MKKSIATVIGFIASVALYVLGDNLFNGFYGVGYICGALASFISILVQAGS